MQSIKGKPFFCSWSGGKDSCLAFYQAVQNGGIPKAFLTMMTEDSQRSRSHGLSRALVNHQAAAIGIPQIMVSASWETYEQRFLSKIHEFKAEGIACGVFGDIDLAAHREWVERVCEAAGIQAYEPLWQRERNRLLEEFLDFGFKAMIISVKDGLLSRDFLGQILDRQVIAEMAKAGIDPSGEEGEYHTVVIDGPLFSFPVQLHSQASVWHDGYCFLELSAGAGQIS